MLLSKSTYEKRITIQATLQKKTLVRIKSFKGTEPGCLLPLSILSLVQADFIQLSEEGMRDVLLVVILRPQQELYPLGRGVR